MTSCLDALLSLLERWLPFTMLLLRSCYHRCSCIREKRVSKKRKRESVNLLRLRRFLWGNRDVGRWRVETAEYGKGNASLTGASTLAYACGTYGLMQMRNEHFASHFSSPPSVLMSVWGGILSWTFLLSPSWVAAFCSCDSATTAFYFGFSFRRRFDCLSFFHFSFAYRFLPSIVVGRCHIPGAFLVSLHFQFFLFLFVFFKSLSSVNVLLRTTRRYHSERRLKNGVDRGKTRPKQKKPRGCWVL